MQTVKVLNSVQALGADATVSNGNLQVVGLTIPIRNIRPSSSVQPYVAQVLQVNTVTPTAANSTFFSYTISGRSTIDNSIKTWTASFTSAVAATQTTISNQLRAILRSFYDLPVTLNADGNATVVITGIAAAPMFSSAQSGSSVGVLATAATTPVTIGYGAGTLIAAGNVLPVSTDTQIVTTNNYTTVTINYIDPTIVETRNSVHDGFSQLVLYVNQGDTDYPTLVGTYGTITQAIKGVVASWAATSDALSAVANGVITLSTDVFYGNTDTNVGMQAGDVVQLNSVNYPIASILSATTAATYGTPNDQAAAAGFYIKLRPAV